MKKRDLLKWTAPAVMTASLPSHAQTSVSGCVSGSSIYSFSGLPHSGMMSAPLYDGVSSASVTFTASVNYQIENLGEGPENYTIKGLIGVRLLCEGKEVFVNVDELVSLGGADGTTDFDGNGGATGTLTFTRTVPFSPMLLPSLANVKVEAQGGIEIRGLNNLPRQPSIRLASYSGNVKLNYSC